MNRGVALSPSDLHHRPFSQWCERGAQTRWLSAPFGFADECRDIWGVYTPRSHKAVIRISKQLQAATDFLFSEKKS